MALIGVYGQQEVVQTVGTVHPPPVKMLALYLLCARTFDPSGGIFREVSTVSVGEV